MECSLGYYLDFKEGVCKKCQSGCAECSGPDERDCLLADGGYFKNEMGSVQMCPQAGCSSCAVDGVDPEEGMVCNDCQEGWGSIRQETKFGTTNFECKPCVLENCGKCEDNPKQCQKCKDGFVFNSGKCVPKTNYVECKKKGPDGLCLDCPEGKRYSWSKSMCVSCPYPCAECGKADECLYCATGYVLNKDSKCVQCQIEGCRTCFDGEDKCVSCARGLYFDFDSKSCKKCHKTCATCTGPLETDCTFCPFGRRAQSIVYAGANEKQVQAVMNGLKKKLGNLKDYSNYIDTNVHPNEDRYCLEKCKLPEEFGKRFIESIPAYSKDRCPTLEVKYAEKASITDQQVKEDL